MAGKSTGKNRTYAPEIITFSERKQPVFASEILLTLQSSNLQYPARSSVFVPQDRGMAPFKTELFLHDFESERFSMPAARES
jgi:hypothetical protein